MREKETHWSEMSDVLAEMNEPDSLTYNNDRQCRTFLYTLHLPA